MADEDTGSVKSDVVVQQEDVTDENISELGEDEMAPFEENAEDEYDGEQQHEEVTEGEELGQEEEGDEKVLGKIGSSPIYFMSDLELATYIQELESLIKQMHSENMVLQNFLEKNSPSSIEPMEQMLSFARSRVLQQESKEEPRQGKSVYSEKLSRASIGSSRIASSRVSIENLLDGRAHQIPVTIKTEMAIRTLEDVQQAHQSFMRKCEKIKSDFKSELEECVIRENDLNYAQNTFQYNVVIHGVDILTGKVTAEKWTKFMEDWLKSAGLSMEKLRLRCADLKSEYKKLSITYFERRELGSNIHEVDFDQLEIANKHLQVKTDQKQVHLTQLKKMNGRANVILSKQKKYLLQQQTDYNRIQEQIEAKQKQIQYLEEEFDKVDNERENAKDKYEYLKKFRNEHRVPDVMEYVELKKELDEIKKDTKIWQRRKKIQEISLNSSLRQIKHLTGSTTIDPSWIQEDAAEDTDENFHLPL